MSRVRVAVVGVLSLVALTAASCAFGSRSFDTVEELYAAAGGEQWCGGELRVVLEDLVGSCGVEGATDRVVLGVFPEADAVEQMRISVASTRDDVAGDVLVLVTRRPGAPGGFQLRTTDRELLEQAQERLGGEILDSEDDVDGWLGEPGDGDAAGG